MNTIWTNSGSLIALIMKKIKGGMDSRILCTWKGNCGEEAKELLAIFMAHIDVSELPVKVLQKGIPIFQKSLAPYAFSLGMRKQWDEVMSWASETGPSSWTTQTDVVF